MLTRLLHAGGLYLGTKSELMPAQADNPDGFWEHLGSVALNDELLSELGGAWDLPPKADEDFKHSRLDGLRLWEIYNRRLAEAADKRDRLFTHCELFFENAKKALRRIANCVGLPHAK